MPTSRADSYKKYSVLILAQGLLISGLSGCSLEQMQGVKPIVPLQTQDGEQNTPAESIPKNFFAEAVSFLQNVLSGEEDLSGTAASNTQAKSLSQVAIPGGWKLSPSGYFLVSAQALTSVPLTYQTTSGGTVYAFAWAYVGSNWQQIGWQINNSNSKQFNGAFKTLTGTKAVLVGFFSQNGGTVSATLGQTIVNPPPTNKPPQNYSGYRNADYRDTWKTLGPFNQTVFQNGTASHALSPAELIYYAAKENDSNPVLLLSKLQDEQSLLTGGKTFKTASESKPDFEWRLARACGYAQADSGDNPKYYGFFPQVVSTTYQFSLFKQRGKNFQEAYQSFTTGAGKYNNFVNTLYPPYARAMNQITGKQYSEKPASEGYFRDFRDISVEHVQKFLEQYSGALKEKDLFQQKPESSAKIQYP